MDNTYYNENNALRGAGGLNGNIVFKERRYNL